LKDSVDHRAIAILADASSLPFEQVAQIYAQELSQLERSARVKKFLPIFTYRNVQEKLLGLHPA
jgi:hypothetical protein